MQENYNMSQYDEEIQITPKHDVILVWERMPNKVEKAEGYIGKIVMYHNCTTGKQSANKDNVIEKDKPCRVIWRKSRPLTATYWQATSDNKFLCCIVATFSLKAIKAGEVRSWQEEERYYFSKKKEVIVSNSYYGGVFTEDRKHKIRTEVSGKNLHYDYTKYPNMNASKLELHSYEVSAEFRKEAYKVFNPIAIIGGNRMLEIYNPSHFDYFWMYKEPTVKTGPKQRKINELVSIPLPKVDMPDVKVFKSRYYWYTHQGTKFFAVVNKIRDGFVCIRTMAIVENEGDKDNNYLCEGGRIYIEGKNVIACKPNNFGEYVSTTLTLSDSQWDYPIIDFNPDDLKGTILEYFGSIVKELPDRIRCVGIKNFLKNPILEQLYKGGLGDVIVHGFYTSYDNSMSTIDNLIKLDLNEKNFYSIIGINKNQLKMLKDRWDSYTELDFCRERYNSSGYDEISIIKNALGNNNISSYDDETFKKVLGFITLDLDRKWAAIESFKLVRSIYGLKTALNIIEDIKKIDGKHATILTRWGHSTIDAINAYKDYLDMVSKMGAINNFKAYFDDVDDIVNMHDAAVTVYNTQKDKYQNEAFIKAVKRVEKYEFSDNNYSIITPKLPADMANEGLKLHHCVRSYIDRVISGSTNILFLRKNEELDEPFFTIELSNSGSIEQIHGFANRNANTEPDMLYFVDDWIKAKKLKKNDFNKVR